MASCLTSLQHNTYQNIIPRVAMDAAGQAEQQCSRITLLMFFFRHWWMDILMDVIMMVSSIHQMHLCSTVSCSEREWWSPSLQKSSGWVV